MDNTTQAGKIELPKLNFEPLFYIMDYCKHRVLAAKRQDKYEVSGVYIEVNKETKEWEVYPASFRSQECWEYPTRYVITHDADECAKFCDWFSIIKLPTDDYCLRKFPRSEDFPIY